MPFENEGSIDSESETKAIGNLDRFFDIALDMLCISSDDGYFKRLNPAFSLTLGWSIEELLKTPYIELVHPDDIDATLAEVERQMAAGERVLHFENRYRHKDGSYRILAWKSVPQPGGFMYAVARDVTEQREQEQLLREKNADLEQFSRAVAHDLRAPLRAIGGFAEILSREIRDHLNEEQLSDFQRIVSNAEKMGRMLDGLLRFSRAGIQELDKSDVDLNRLVAEIVRDLREQNPSREIEFKISALPSVHADPDMMKIVFGNLLSNAVKYTRLRNVAKIEVGFENHDRPPTFFVRDNGAGFDMKYVDKLFGVFERIHPVAAYEGSGIGLATVQRVLQRHGGSIWAEGEEGVGATFYFRL